METRNWSVWSKGILIWKFLEVFTKFGNNGNIIHILRQGSPQMNSIEIWILSKIGRQYDDCDGGGETPDISCYLYHSTALLHSTFNTHGVRTYHNISQVQSVLCQDSSLFNGSYSSPYSPVMTRHSNSWTVFLLLVKLPQLAVRVLQGDEHDVLSCQARLSVLRVGKLGMKSLWPVADPGQDCYKWFSSKPHLVISTLCQN